MRRAPIVLTVTAAGVAAVLAYEPDRPPAVVARAAAVDATAGQATDGPVQGTHYGDVQVRVRVADGRLVDVAALLIPTGDPRSAQINAWAEPLLRERVLAAQSAEVDIVSGATITSDAYIASLRVALTDAGLG